MNGNPEKNRNTHNMKKYKQKLVGINKIIANYCK